MTILRSTGPVISTRLSVSPGPVEEQRIQRKLRNDKEKERRSACLLGGGPVQESSSRMCLVSGRKSSRAPASSCFWRRTRRCRSDWRVASKFRWRIARKVRASGVRISLWGPIAAVSSGAEALRTVPAHLRLLLSMRSSCVSALLSQNIHTATLTKDLDAFGETHFGCRWTKERRERAAGSGK
jgi:hypothetical protein